VLKGRFEDQDFGKQVEKEGEEKEVYFRRPASPFVSSNGGSRVEFVTPRDAALD
jgi:hypothetical protein